MSDVRRPYPFNQWYVGALSTEIGRFLFPRTLLGLPVVFYRDDDGRAVAAFGRCPHRGYPMHRGKLVDGGLRCGYHGLTFDRAGRCAPAGDAAAPHGGLRTFAVVETPPLVWIWLGDEDAADPASIPVTADLGVGEETWRVECSGYLNVRARYTLLCDNLLDISHIDFVHERSLERSPLAFEPQADARELVGVMTRESRGNDATTFAALFPDLAGLVDVVMRAEFRGVGWIVAVGTDFYRSSIDGEPRTPLAKMAFAHAVTPQTATSTHYFPFFMRNFRVRDEEFSMAMGARNLLVAREDAAVVEELEIALAASYGPGPEFSLPSDAAGLAARRKIAALIDAEAPAQ